MINKDEAYGILGLTSKASELDIERRYAVLVKRYHAEENNAKLEEVSLAYNIAKGIYVEPIQESPKMKKVILGKTRSEWKNILYYGRGKYIAIALAVLIVGSTAYTMITNTPPDFKVAVIGEFSVEDPVITENYVKSLYPEFEKVEVESVYINKNEADSFYGSAFIQKAMLLLTASNEDVVILDRYTFNQYAGGGAFLPIGDLYEAILAMDETDSLDIEAMKATIPTNSDGSGTEEIYGIDISDSELLSSIGISGRDQIIAISIHTDREQITKEFITKLFADTEDLLPDVTRMPLPTPSTIPVSGSSSAAASTAS